MNKTVFFILVFSAALQISGFSQKRDMPKADTLRADSLEYKLIVIDPGFESWLATKPSKLFYSQSYYEQKNRLYVTEWNHRYMTYHGRVRYDSYIDYDFRIDYGLDLNYKLYYYFRYFEEKNNVRLINTSR
jgi:hypothetical protein